MAEGRDELPPKSPMSGGSKADRVLALFAAISALPAAEQESAVAEACGEDPALAAELRSLLGYHDDERADLLVPESQALRSFAVSALESERHVGIPERIGNFRIECLLGEGGMGRVLAARQESPRRKVALKVIRPGYVSPSAMRRFRSEIEILGRLQHPGIAQVYEAGEAILEGVEQPFIAMEFVEGSDLHSWAQDRSLDEKVSIMIEIARAVHHAHQRGVIHRDLKPANILVGENDQPKILDFGIARASFAADDDESRSTSSDHASRPGRAADKTPTTRTGQIVGTLDYMSPEQLQGRRGELGFASDVYALGVITFEIIGGSLPHDLRDKSLSKVIDLVCRRRARPLRDCDPSLPRALEHVTGKALAKEIGERYASAASFADDLERYLNHRPVHARPPSALQNLSLFARRNPALTTSFALLFVALIGGFIFSSLFARRAADAQLTAEREARESDRTAYRLALASAEIALRNHDVGEARRFLSQIKAPNRGWEWRHLHSRLDESLAALSAASRDYGRLMSPLRILHDSRTRRSGDQSPATEAEVPRREARRVRFLCIDGKLQINEARPGAEIDLATRRVHDIDRLSLGAQSKPSFALLPDGRLAGLDRKAGVLWEESALGAGPRRSYSIDEIPLLEDGVDMEIREVSGLRIGRPKERDEWHLLHDAGRQVIYSVIDPQESRVAFVGLNSSRRVIEIYDRNTGRRLHQLKGHPESPRDVAFSPNGRYLAAAIPDGTVIEHDLSGASSPRVLRGHDDRVVAVVYSPDGELIASGSQDATVRLWRRQDDRPERTLVGHSREVQGLTFEDEATLISIDSSGELRRWSLDSHLDGVMRGHSLYVYPLALSPDGMMLASGDWNGEMRVWNSTTAELLHRHQIRETSSLYDILFSFVMLHDGRNIAITSGSGSYAPHDLAIHDLRSGALIRSLGKVSALSTLGLTSRPPRLIVAGRGQGHVFDPVTGELTGHFEKSNRGLAIHPKGDRFAYRGGDGRIIMICDASTLEVRQRIDAREALRDIRMRPVNALAFSPDGRHFAMAADRDIAVFEVESGHLVRLIDGHAEAVLSLAYSPDGSRLASGSDDRSVRIWDTSDYSALVSLRGHRDQVQTVLWSADGERLYSSSGDYSVRLWDTRSLRERHAAGKSR
jgi:eukaryotic-like serine/threonine-protein kinase